MAKILVIDDSSFQRGMIRRALQGLGHEILEAENGISALEIISANKVDFIFLDLIMPKMDGFETLEKLREMGNKIPVVVLTSDVQILVHQRCLSLGALNVLTKPPKKGELEKVLGELLPR